MTPQTKQPPVPTRFATTDTEFINQVSKRYGLSRSEIIRRSVRLLHKESNRPGFEQMIWSLV